MIVATGHPVVSMLSNGVQPLFDAIQLFSMRVGTSAEIPATSLQINMGFHSVQVLLELRSEQLAEVARTKTAMG